MTTKPEKMRERMLGVVVRKRGRYKCRLRKEREMIRFVTLRTQVDQGDMRGTSQVCELVCAVP